MTAWNLNRPRAPRRPSAWISGACLGGALGYAGICIPALPVLPAALAAGVMAALLGTNRPGTLGWISGMLTAALAALAAVLLGEAVLSAALGRHWHALRFPLFINPMEGREALKAWMVQCGEQLYSPLNGYPYLLTLYGPVYYLLAGALSKMTAPGLFAARLVSAAAFATILACTFTIVRRASDSRLAALLAVVALFCQGVMESGSFARPDMLAWAFVFLAATLLMGGEKPSATPFQNGAAPLSALAAVAPAILLALAMFTKQQTWLFAASCILFAPALRGWRFALALALFTMLLGLGGVLAAQVMTNGEFLKQTVFFPAAMADLGALNDSRSAWDRLRTFWQYEHWLILLWACGALWNLLDRKFWLPDVVLLIFAPFLFIVLRWSSAEYNHFIPVVIFMSCGAGLMLGRLAELSPALPLAAVLLLVAQTPNLEATLEDSIARRAQAALAKSEFLEVLNVSPGPILCDTESAYLALGHPAFARLRLFDAFELAIAAQTGLWNPASSTLLRDVAARAFPLAVSCRNFQPAALEALKGLFYQPAGELAKTRIEIPRIDPGIAAVLDFGLQPHGAEALKVTLTSMENLRVEDGWLAVDKPGQSGVAVFTVEGTGLPGSITATVWPRLNRSNPESEWAFAAEDRVLAAARFDEGLGWTPIWEGPLRLEWNTGSTLSELTIRLRGEGQLWLDAGHPMAFTAKPGPAQAETPAADGAQGQVEAQEAPVPAQTPEPQQSEIQAPPL